MAPALDARRERLGRPPIGVLYAAEDQALESVEVVLWVAAARDAQAVGVDPDVGHHGLSDLRAVGDGDAGEAQKITDRVGAALPLAAAVDQEEIASRQVGSEGLAGRVQNVEAGSGEGVLRGGRELVQSLGKSLIDREVRADRA